MRGKRWYWGGMCLAKGANCSDHCRGSSLGKSVGHQASCGGDWSFGVRGTEPGGGRKEFHPESQRGHGLGGSVASEFPSQTPPVGTFPALRHAVWGLCYSRSQEPILCSPSTCSVLVLVLRQECRRSAPLLCYFRSDFFYTWKQTSLKQTRGQKKTCLAVTQWINDRS